MINLTIEPLVGAGPFKFGETLDQALLNYNAKSVDPGPNNTLIDENLAVVFDENGLMNYFGFFVDSEAVVMFEGSDLCDMTLDEVLRYLAQYDDCIVICAGDDEYFFRNLQFCVTGLDEDTLKPEHFGMGGKNYYDRVHPEHEYNQIFIKKGG